MRIVTYADRRTMSRAAAGAAADLISTAIAQRGTARLVAATGASQFDFLEALVAAPGIDWRQVELFHLDEYVGLSIEHPASFRRYLLDRLIGPAGIVRYHLLDAEHDAARTAREVGALLAARPVDVAFAGIGENGHLAFNDPPADFDATAPYIVVSLDERCRQQQVGEGWFRGIDEVPATAISMSVHQILQARTIVCVVPDRRKAEAVRATLEEPVSPAVPASILRTHEDTTLYLDRDSASALDRETLDRFAASA